VRMVHTSWRVITIERYALPLIRLQLIADSKDFVVCPNFISSLCSLTPFSASDLYTPSLLQLRTPAKRLDSSNVKSAADRIAVGCGRIRWLCGFLWVVDCGNVEVISGAVQGQATLIAGR